MMKKQAKKSVTIDELAGMVARGFDHMGQRLDGLASDVAVLKTDVAELKTDVAELKTDVAELKTDVAELKTDVAELKTNLAVLEVTVNRIDIRTQNQVDAVYEETSFLKNDMKTTKKDIILIKTHVGLPVE